MAMLALRHIEKSFGVTPILNDVSLEVEKGDVVAIVGPSGSGKTTLLRIANFLETADKGTYDFEGLSFKLPDVPKKDISAIRSRAGFVFQQIFVGNPRPHKGGEERRRHLSCMR